MSHLPLLRNLEGFLGEDLQREKLSSRNSSKRDELLEQIRAVINEEKENDKLANFLEKQKTKPRSDINRASLPLPQIPELSKTRRSKSHPPVIEEIYMDLNNDDATAYLESSRNTSPLGAYGGGSGSGYESYASDEEGSNKLKSEKEENLDTYYSGDTCDIYSIVFVENKTFLSGKKWMKRIGIVKESHFQCFKKAGDSQAVLDLPLRAYTATLSNKEGTDDMIVSLEAAGSDDVGYRFYVQHKKANDWSRVLREKAASVMESEILPVTAPVVPSRPLSSLPPSERSVQRQPSISDPPKLAINDVPVMSKSNITASSVSSPPTSLNNIGKGLKTMFKKDKTKKKISVAEQMGAILCSNLSVNSDGKWAKKLCMIKSNQLLIYGKEEAPEQTILLHGCDLRPSFNNTDKKFAFTIVKEGHELAMLEASSSTQMGEWVGILIAQTGCAEVPEVENIYVEPEFYENVMSTARKAFQQTIKLKNVKAPTTPEIEEDKEEEMYIDLMSPSLSNNKSPTKLGSPDATGRNAISNKREIHDKKLNDQKKERNDDKSHKISSFLEGKIKAKTSDQTKENKRYLNHTEAELKCRIKDIVNRLDRLKATKAELTKYIEATTLPKQKMELQRTLSETTKEYTKLEKEKREIEYELEKRTKQVYEKTFNSPSNKTPPAKTEKTQTNIPRGNVMSRAKMFENLDSNK